jgi:ABC-2 type transport system ATP-binding protein
VNGLCVEALAKTYRGAERPALRGVSLGVEPGQILGLLGPNGAGKSTLIGACTTRVVPTSGTVHIDGIDVAADPVAAKRRIGVVAQLNTLDRAVSVWENLYLHCRYFGITSRAARARADELLEIFALTERRGALVAALSGGQARRLQLARALAHRPRAVFLDEPAVGLDPQSRQVLWDLIDGLRRDGVAVMLTTHDMDEADRLSDTVAVIDHGQVIAEGTPDTLKAQVDASAIITLTVHDDPSGLAQAVATLPLVRGVEDQAPDAVRVMFDGGDKAIASVVEVAVANGLTAVSVEPVTLETVFLTLTGRSLRD